MGHKLETKEQRCCSSTVYVMSQGLLKSWHEYL